MNKFTTITSTCLPIRTENIDTDQIIPARFLKTTMREGLGQYLFFNWRFDEHGHEMNDSIFADSRFKKSKIMLAGNNFGCGSSREHAAWALLDYGFKAVISSSFGDIFYSNSIKNGLLPVVLKPQNLEGLFANVEKKPDISITINLNKQEVSLSENIKKYHFPIDSFHKTCLLKGVDEMGYIKSFEKHIEEFEKNHRIFISNT